MNPDASLRDEFLEAIGNLVYNIYETEDVDEARTLAFALDLVTRSLERMFLMPEGVLA